jgi:hypothetical protein
VPKPRVHTAVSLALAALTVSRTGRWRDAIPVLVAGVLVDADHLVDLAANRAAGRVAWAILPLHGWEWVLALLLRRRRTSDGLAMGLAAHVALDQALNTVVTHPLFYWVLIRARYGFRAGQPLVDPERWTRGSRWMHQHPGTWF